MSVGTDTASPAARGEISRLIAFARQHGEADTYLGKRKWVRYSLGMPLEVTTDPDNPSAAWRVIMHNISGGGFGLWSKQSVAPRSTIYVREHGQDHAAEWLPAFVRNCIVGIRGYLIGAAFIHPIEPEPPAKSAEPDPDPPSHAGPGPHTRTDRISQRVPPMSLRTKCGLAAATAGFAAIETVALLLHSDQAQPWSFWGASLWVAAAWAFVLGWLAGTWLVKNDLKFIRDFHQFISQMAKGFPNPPPLAAAPSTELLALRNTLMEVGTAWRNREDAERAQRQKLQELNQIKSNLLSIVSHDLRTPMTSILLYARMLAEELDTLPKNDQLHFLKIISDECTRLSRLVDDLLEVQRLESGRARWDIKPLNISETIHACVDVFEAMADSKAISLTVDCPPTLPLVETDADRISQLLSNLLSNALKYTPSGGKVHVSARSSSSEIVICVADTGPGIPREKWDQIFDRFSQLSNPNTSEIAGVGLGLYIVRQIVEILGGAVWLDSEEGRGSEFFVSLPTRTVRAEPEPGPETPSSRGRILVGDADPQIAALIAQTLRHDGFDIRVAHSGLRLIAQLDQGDTDVVITDLLMPDMNATALLEALNKTQPRPFRLIIHSYAGDDFDLRRRGADIVLRRPATKEELRQAVHVALRSQSASGLAVVMVDSPTLDLAQFKRTLAEAGHVPIAADTVPHAAALLNNYTIDVVLLSAETLGHDWAKLKLFTDGPEQSPRIIVLCTNLRRKERRLADHHGVTALAYCPGDESRILDSVQPPWSTRPAEHMT
ncbi:MAG: hybrid sensor histidine kinase/response regulator [Phycisphaerales bacterium]|nr:MAG: hybrid sensor histidine kinase/response regulator [Phycisphaerales bacterium]